MNKRITVTSQTDTGRNTKFHDNYKNVDMSRTQFANQINAGNYSNYVVKNINGVKTPVSKADNTKNNNLG